MHCHAAVHPVREEDGDILLGTPESQATPIPQECQEIGTLGGVRLRQIEVV